MTTDLLPNAPATTEGTLPSHQPSPGESVARAAPLPCSAERLHAMARDSGLPMSWLDKGIAAAWPELETFARHVAQATREETPLSPEEIRYILSSPEALSALMTFHILQQQVADAIGLEIHGNADRYQELKALGRKVIEADPEEWPRELRHVFGIT